MPTDPPSRGNDRPPAADGPPARGLDAVATLAHFAIVTWAVAPEALRPHVHSRFDLDLIRGADGADRALVSVVPFEDQDFHFAALPWWRWRFPQTNYRVYVRDRQTDERLVWFLGTCLDSWTVAVPRLLWRLPWHRGRSRFDCRWNAAAGRYDRWSLRTESDWAPLELELADAGHAPQAVPGFPNLDEAMQVLTHPLQGVFYRQDGRLGSYSVWHAPLQPTAGRLLRARVGLLDRLGILSYAEQEQAHSVLMQPSTLFRIYLPPRRLAEQER
ncbi:MAG: DUF2071 domain-containing protein [Ardenticatenia bacterium]|nr:DUF2071 domain-containing protein [Ardenticatenia bacterium]